MNGGESVILYAAVIISALNLAFGLLRTYYARYAKKTYQGSVEYWGSWEKRKYDVAAQVLREMGIESPDDMKKLVKKFKRAKKKVKK